MFGIWLRDGGKCGNHKFHPIKVTLGNFSDRKRENGGKNFMGKLLGEFYPVTKLSIGVGDRVLILQC